MTLSSLKIEIAQFLVLLQDGFIKPETLFQDPLVRKVFA